MTSEQVNTAAKTASDAWVEGYSYAIRGFARKAPAKSWMSKMWRDFYAGWDYAEVTGQFGTYRV